MKKETLKESNRLDDLEIEEMSNDWETMSQQISTTTNQTAVEWLAEKYNYVTWMRNRDEISAGMADEWRKHYLDQAKEMEKEQMGDTWVDSRIEDNGDAYIGKQKSFEEYYNETFKSK